MNNCKSPSYRTRRSNVYFPGFDSIVREMFSTTPVSTARRAHQPAANVSYTDDAYQLALALPGMSKKDVHISVDNDVLIIKSERERTEEQNYRLREFNYDQFERRFRLPKDANADDIKASFKKGILNIQIAKKEEITRTIAIK